MPRPPDSRDCPNCGQTLANLPTRCFVVCCGFKAPHEFFVWGIGGVDERQAEAHAKYWILLHREARSVWRWTDPRCAPARIGDPAR